MPRPQYLEQPVFLPLQYFQQIWGLTKWVPPQYLAPSKGPGYQLFILNVSGVGLANKII